MVMRWIYVYMGWSVVLFFMYDTLMTVLLQSFLAIIMNMSVPWYNIILMIKNFQKSECMPPFSFSFSFFVSSKKQFNFCNIRVFFSICTIELPLLHVLLHLRCISSHCVLTIHHLWAFIWTLLLIHIGNAFFLTMVAFWNDVIGITWCFITKQYPDTPLKFTCLPYRTHCFWWYVTIPYHVHNNMPQYMIGPW